MTSVDKIIQIIHQLREESMASGGMTTQSSTGNPGFSASAEDPVAGVDAFLGKRKKKNGTVDFRRIPPNYKKWVTSLKR